MAYLGLIFVSVLAYPTHPPLERTFVEVVRSQFASWDTNHDQILSRAEVDALVNNPAIRGEEAAAVATIKRLQRGKKATLEDLPLADLPKILKDAAPKYRSMVKKLSNLNQAIFSENEPSLIKIHQGPMGNCFMLAPVGSLVNLDPATIRKMIKVLPDRKVEVAFGASKILTDLPTDVEIAMGGRTENGGIYLNILEKAYGRLVASRKHSDVESATDAIASGGSATPFLQAVTSDKPKHLRLGPKQKNPDKAALELLEVAKMVGEHKSLAVLGTATEVKTKGISPKHAYAILGAEGSNIIIWNPHGQTYRPKGTAGIEFGYPTTHGIFKVPASEVVQIFLGLTHCAVPKI